MTVESIIKSIGEKQKIEREKAAELINKKGGKAILFSNCISIEVCPACKKQNSYNWINHSKTGGCEHCKFYYTQVL